MEKQTKSAKMKFLRFLPKASAFTFQNPPFSPTKAQSSKTRSGPIIPAEARFGPNKSLAREPTSPKISCMGRIKHKKKYAAKEEKVKIGKGASLPKNFKLEQEEPIRRRNVFANPKGRKPDTETGERAPSLSQMRRFASGRDSLGNFDWTTQVLPAGGEEEEAIISFSAPIGANGIALEPKKEINLWKRRTMVKPPSLRIEN